MNSSIIRTTYITLAFCVACCLIIVPPTAQSQKRARNAAFFENKIRPVLVEHCYQCHSAKATSLKGGLRVDSKMGLRRGGESGPAIVPKNVEDSLLISALRHESFEMPPKGKLPDAVIEDFVTWVKQGAADPRVAGESKNQTIGEKKTLWSLQPLRKTLPPTVDDSSWPSTAIDRFIMQRLNEVELKPSPPADRRTQLRRLYFDLIGLPPTPEELAAFLSDEGPHVWAAIVDRLLAAPQFGERWGRHWLDVARFAESSGGGRTQLFPDAWRYRDYVIDSVNGDKPFDVFVKEQVAGDLMEAADRHQRAQQLTAVGFLALGPTNYELQDKELLRMEVVDEQIDTIGRAFLGLTIGCARCHDHKFDPIPTTDYYALAGIFRSTKTLTPGNVSGWVTRTLPVSAVRQQALKEHAGATQDLERKIKRAQSLIKKLTGVSVGNSKATGAKSRLRASLAGIVIDNTEAKLIGSWIESTSSPYFVDGEYLHDGNEGKGEKSVIFSPQLPAAGRYDVRVAYSPGTNRTQRAPFVVRHAEGESNVVVDQQQSPPIDGLFVSLGEFRFHQGDGAEVVISNENTEGHVIADAVQFLSVELDGAKRNEPNAPASGASPNNATAPVPAASAVGSKDAKNQQRANQAYQQLAKLQAELARLKKTAPPPAPTVMSVTDEQQTGDFHVCIRGSVHNLGQEVPRGFLTAISQHKPQIAPDASGRLETAQWLASAKNPLTARVIVNRVWRRLFGEGLVRTTDNFGHMGEPPSHPLLLDYLANQLIRRDWSIKQLVRSIVLSKVYQFRSRPSGLAKKVDPENRRLSHFNRRRLEAEALRDAMLVFSGSLDLSNGGRTIKPSVKTELGYEFSTRRRSVYTPVFRNTFHPLMEAFDFADPNLVVGDRNTSTLPTQGLYLMNSPFVMEQAQRAARRAIAHTADRQQRIAMLFEWALARLPTAEESRLVWKYLRENRTEEEVAVWEGVGQMLLGCLDFRYVE